MLIPFFLCGPGSGGNATSVLLLSTGTSTFQQDTIIPGVFLPSVHVTLNYVEPGDITKAPVEYGVS